MKNIHKNVLSISVFAISLFVILLNATISKAFDQQASEFEIIKKDDIERYGLNNWSDYFFKYTGADITDYGQPGSNRQIGLLGLLDRHTLIRLDGRPVNANQKDKADINAIPVNQIQKIRIKKGLSSVLDGPNAFGGTIDFITREGMYSEIPYTRLYSRWGTAHLETYGFNFDNRNGSFQYSLFGEKKFNRGYWANSKYNAKNFNTKFDWYYSPNAWFTIIAGEYDDKKGIPGIFDYFAEPDAEENKDKYSQLKYEVHFSDISLKIKFYNDKDLTGFYEGLDYFSYENEAQGKEAVIEQKIGKYNLVRLGGDHHWSSANTSIITNADKEKISVRENSLFFEDEFNWKNLLLTLGVRHDRNSLFEKEYNPRFGLNYTINKSSQVYMGAGRGFQPPTFNDIYLPIQLQRMAISQVYYKSNPNLLPEKGWVYTLGYGKDFTENLSIGFDAHLANLENSMVLNYNYDSGLFCPENIPKVLSRGMDAHISFYLRKNIKIQTNYTYIKAFDDDTKKVLPYRPQHKARTVITYDKVKHNGDLVWIIKLDNEYQSDSYVNRINSWVLKGFNIYNMSIAMKLAKSFTLDFSINNILDERYFLVDGYRMPYRNFWGGVTWEFWD